MDDVLLHVEQVPTLEIVFVLINVVEIVLLVQRIMILLELDPVSCQVARVKLYSPYIPFLQRFIGFF